MQVSHERRFSVFARQLAIFLLFVWFAFKRVLQSFISGGREARQVSAYNPKLYWQKRSRTFIEEDYQRNLYWQHGWMLDKLHYLKAMRVLEIGCGFGRNLRFFASELNGSAKLVGVDLSQRMLTHAQSYLNGTLIPLAVADAAHLPFADESFDVVVIHGVFMHIPPALITLAVREANRVSGGHVIQCEQNYSGRSPNGSGVVQIDNQTYAYDYRRLFSENGFFIIDQQSVDDLDAYFLKKRQAKYDLQDKINLDELAPDNSHVLAINYVPQHATVLDIACSTGYIGCYLVENKGCTVDGVELDPKAARYAELSYRHVWRGNIEDSETITRIHEKYDVILCAAVLEHLVSPGLVLGRLKNLLKPSGFIIVSLPNIAHWQIRWELLRGRFEYQDYGILDRTHLHFYTPETMRTLFRECSFRVVEEAFSVYGPGDLDSALLKIPFCGKRARQRLVNQFPALFAQEFIFKLSPDAPV